MSCQIRMTLPSLGLFGLIGSPGTYLTHAYGPGGFKLALFRRDLRLGLRFGKRVSVKLWKALDGGIHGSLGRRLLNK